MSARPVRAAARAPTLATRLELGRVSNLPTVWSDAVAAAVLSGAPLAAGAGAVLALLAALSLFYVAGMYLNDAWDADIDAVERPARPIPSGRATRAGVVADAALMFAAGAALLAAARLSAPGAAGTASVGWIVAGALLVGAIVRYDRAHKGVAHAPLVMGACRLLVFVVAAFTLVGELPLATLGGGALVCAWVVGLTLVAKRERGGPVTGLWPLALLAAPLGAGLVALARGETLVALPLAALLVAAALAARWFRRGAGGDVPRAVGLMIAGVSLVDAVLIAGTGNLDWTIGAMVAFALTLLAQRHIAGT